MCMEKSCPAPPLSTPLNIPRAAFLRYSCSAGRDWYLMQGDLHYRLPPQGQEKVSLPCAHLAKWETTYLITAHTKHTSLIGSNHIAVNIDNNPEFKASLLDGTQRDFARPKAVPQPRFSFDHSLQVAPAAEPFSGTC